MLKKRDYNWRTFVKMNATIVTVLKISYRHAMVNMVLKSEGNLQINKIYIRSQKQ
jgi:ribosomal protein S1